MKLDRRQALGLLGAGVATSVQAQPAPAQGAFAHGVASGDPLQDRVIIWTRASANGAVRWEVAEDEGFRRIARKGVAHADPARDNTVKVDVTGLGPGRDYFYRFHQGPAVSPVGRTRTLPDGPTPDAVIAVASCALWAGGHFNAYGEIAKLPRVDAVVHLGDYIYEYGVDGFGADIGPKIGRIVDPPHECVTLADYRRRHAQVKSDPQAQAAHARAPWMVVWDDHETANDSWTGGAENHQPATEGGWTERKAAAMQAWYEWMPIREPLPGRAFEAINRSFHFGDLASLIMVETRLAARAHPLDYQTDLLVNGQPNPQGFAAKLMDPARTMMGERQEAWVASELADSVKSGRRWQVLGNQVVMARVTMPNIQEAMGEAFGAFVAKLPEYAKAPVQQSVGIARMNLPASLDAWDGYPVARERLYGAMKAARATPIVISGDSHAFWANELADASGARVAAEFGATAVSSPGFGDILGAAPVSEGFTARNKEVVFNDQSAKGFLLLTLTKEAARAEMVAVSNVYTPQYERAVLKTFEVRPAEAGVGPVTAV